MSRVKLSEFRAKSIVSDYLGEKYQGISFDAENDAISKIDEGVKVDTKYVVKVDQGIKKRFKQGLIKLNLESAHEVIDALQELKKKGFNHFLIEEMLPHDDNDERYLAFERTDRGTLVHFSQKGGVDIESHENEVRRHLIKDVEDVKKIAGELGLEDGLMEKLLELFDIEYFSFLEINPLVISFKKPYFLDIASEVDSAAEFFVDNWNLNDVRNAKGDLTEEEIAVRKLSEKSSSSLTLTVLNPNGSIFMLLSGGGVCVVLSDEVANLGYGEELADYGEYSGNPTEEETYIYTKNLLSLLLKSEAPKKVLIIGGGVANFTDIRTTFKGVIRALDEVSEKLRNQKVKVFVRRGGPHQKEGLAAMEKFLSENEILGAVHGPELVVSEIVSEAIESLSS
jgi:ATP-citrate lyase beta-subunit